jgi:riboflavin kinase / FMN adenylyltransferase
MCKGAPVRAIVIGVFDGVHRGHQALVARAVAATDGGEVVVVTFEPHPMRVVRPDSAPPLLSSLQFRRELLAEAGATEVKVIDFTPEFSKKSPEEFVDYVLNDLLEGRSVDLVVAGSNFRFGRGAEGDTEVLAALGQDRGFTVDVVPLITEDVAGEGVVTWSSTYVRDHLERGDVRRAAHVLGRLHRIEGVVVHGAKRGRELGYPTANVAQESPSLVPADGVYAGWLQDGARVLPAAISVGTNPQFGGDERTVEAYCIDQGDMDEPQMDLYGHHVVVEFVDRLRGQQVFTGIPELVEQMGRDVDAARRLLAAENPPNPG